MNENHKHSEADAALDALIQELYDDGTFQDSRAEEEEDWWEIANEPEDLETFELFWASVKEYADQLKLPVWYVESEFVIDGILVKNTRTL